MQESKGEGMTTGSTVCAREKVRRYGRKWGGGICAQKACGGYESRQHVQKNCAVRKLCVSKGSQGEMSAGEKGYMCLWECETAEGKCLLVY